TQYLLSSLAAIAICASPASAQQLLEATDGQVITGYVSTTGVTRLSFVGDGAASVQMSQGGDGPGFSIVYEPAKGDLYLTLARVPRPGERASAASFFVTTREGFTYQLELSAREVPSTQISVRNPEITLKAAKARASSDPKETRIVTLTRAMWSGWTVDGYQIERPFQRERAAGSLRLSVGAVYKGRDLTGRILNVRNSTPGMVSIDEALFMAPGVLSVTLKGPRDLEAGQDAQILIVDEGEGAFAQ
ncbi:MAG: type-F conjugative transfer system secretin TraK, partial [Pseudomonadota bacterium]